MKGSVMRVISFYLSSVVAGFLCLAALTFPNFGNAATLDQLWATAIQLSGRTNWCGETGKCRKRPAVVYTAIMDDGLLGEVLFKEPETVYVRQFLYPEEESAVLVHEFVHVLQLRQWGIERSYCRVLDMETEAWAVTNRYQVARGGKPWPTAHALDPLRGLCLRRK